MSSDEAKPVVEVAESYPMKGGDGTYSYTKNSSFQRKAANSAKEMVLEAIAEKLDIEQLSATSTTFRFADLGCSVGPNTFIAMQNVLEAVEHKCIAHGLAASKMPEFQVFFNDYASNDFNTLFASLPPERQYFAAGVPGSFYGRLFPKSSLHFAYSSYALQWLSKVPEELLDKNSPAWNKGKIHYTDAPSEVADAYAAQYARDMGMFLDARAKELVVGGMLMLIILGTENGSPYSPAGVMFDLLGSSLIDMAKEGLISEAQMDSFNLPIYAVSPREMTQLVEINGCFSIERMELTSPSIRIDAQIHGKELTMHLRAGMEGIISKRFGTNIIDELFDRYFKKTQEFSDQLESSNKGGTQLFVVLKRK